MTNTFMPVTPNSLSFFMVSQPQAHAVVWKCEYILHVHMLGQMPRESYCFFYLYSTLYFIIICKSASIQSQLIMSLSTRHRPSLLPFLFHTGNKRPVTPSWSEWDCLPWYTCQNCSIVVELKPNGRNIEARLL